MSIDTPNGILDITNAIVRVSKMEFQQATGFDTVLNNIARNTILLSDSATYETHSTYHNWALKLPNAWVFEADVYFQSGTPGVAAKLNFYNNVNTAITNGYTLELDGTSLVLKYDGTQISTATLSTTLNDDAWHKLFVLFERDTIAVAIDGKAEYTFTDSELRARVYNDDTGYVVFYHESGTYARKIKNLKFVNGDKWLRESGSSNIAYVGGSVGVGTDAPKHTLDVFGDANVGTLTSTGIYGEIVGSNAVGASTGTFSGDLQVGTANLFVDVSTSNVGIGTDTPLATLDVQGDFSAGVTGNLFVNSDTGSVGISNTAPVHTLDIGSNVYVQEGGDTVLYVSGNAVVSKKLTVESFRISSSSSSGLQAVTSGIGANSTTNRIEITNADNSTSTSTGALALTNGGLGVAGDIVAGGSLTLSSDLAVDTNTLKVDAANNRVGILTASPQYGLDVHGTANVGALTATSSTVSGALSGGSASISGALSAASASITGQLLVDTDTLTVDAVNDRVGVNTASPQYDLDVSGNVAVSSNLMVNTNTLFVDSVNSRVGVGTTEPSQAFEVSGNVQVGTANLFVDTTTGNVGIGVTDPGHNLDIVSEMNLRSVSNTASIKYNSNVVTEYVRSKKLIKYPRVAMTAATTSGYTASASTDIGSTWEAWNAFDNNTGTGWHSNSRYTTSSGAYSGSEYITDHEGTQVDGEWIKLQMPEKIRLEYVLEKPRPGFALRAPKEETLLASNDGTTWYILATRDKATFNDKISKIWEIRAQQYYKYYALVVEKIGKKSNADTVQLMEIEYYGVPEYDPDAHGTDVMLKAVPNDLPSTSEWLELYWDAEDYSSASDFSGSNGVLDKSGNSKHGTQTGGVGLSTINGIKAFTFDGSTNSIDTTLSNPSGAWVHSACVWIYMNDFKNSCQIFAIDDNNPASYSNDSSAYLVIDSDGAIRYDFHYNPHFSSVGQITPRKWHHVCVQYNGTRQDEFGTSMFIDGIRQRTDRNVHGNFNYTGNQLNIGANAYLFLGGSSFLGNIANFRLHNRVLSDDEVWQFYASQKEHFDVSPNVVAFKNGRMGVGTDEPRAVLDVRGNIFANGRPALPLPVAQFYKKSDGTANQTYTENIRTGRVDWDSVLIDAPGVIERYYWDTSADSNNICTDGTYTGGVFKFCVPGTYIVFIHVCLSRQFAHDRGFGMNLFDCAIGGRFTVGVYDGKHAYGGDNPRSTDQGPFRYEKTHVVHVSAAPAYAWVRIQPSANRTDYFSFNTYGPTPYAAANIIYLG